MTAITFDTLKFADRLQAGGFTAEQSRAAAFAEAVSTSDLVTTQHLDLKIAEVRRDIVETKAEILRWMFGALAVHGALIVALVKLIH